MLVQKVEAKGGKGGQILATLAGIASVVISTLSRTDFAGGEDRYSKKLCDALDRHIRGTVKALLSNKENVH